MSAVVKSKVPKVLDAAAGALSIAAALGLALATLTAAPRDASAAPRVQQAAPSEPTVSLPPTPTRAPRFVNVLQREARSRSLCEARPDRIFVRHQLGSACIAYFATAGREQQRRAVIFLDGDVSLDRYAATQSPGGELEQRHRWQQSLADRFGVRIVRISRLGVEGSSGNHGDRRKPEELVAMIAALDVLKRRLGLDDLVLAGQSGGSTLIASMLTRGRSDVACAVLGSGAYELVDLVHGSIRRGGGEASERSIARVVYDPSTQIEGVPADARRRIFVVGDPADTRTPFDQQQRFAEALTAAGHHARLVPIMATGELRHGATTYSLPLAALCARDASDTRITKAAADMRSSAEKRLREGAGGPTRLRVSPDFRDRTRLRSNSAAGEKRG